MINNIEQFIQILLNIIKLTFIAYTAFITICNQHTHTLITISNNKMTSIEIPETVAVDESKLEVIPKLLAGDLWSDNSEIVTSSLEKLADLCFHNDLEKSVEEQNRTALREFGGHLGIIVAMKKWMINSAVQAAGCRALQNAGIVEDADSEAFHDLAVQVGAFDTILCAMKNYPNHENVQKYGCGALLNLSWYIHNATILVLELQGIDAIMIAMKSFPHIVSIQRRGCAFFKNLTTLNPESFNEPIIEAGARLVLLTAIENHPDDNGEDENSIQGNARVTLKRLL